MTDEELTALRNANTEMQAAEDALGAALTLLASAISEQPSEPTRRVWYVQVPGDAEWMLGELEVLIEQFGDKPPTVAFRRGGTSAVWGRPHRGVPQP